MTDPAISTNPPTNPPAGDGTSCGRAVSLGELRAGECGVIVEKQLDADDRAMLRAMGLEASATIRVCRAGEPCIVAIISGQGGNGAGGAAGAPLAGRLDSGCCRIGLSRDLSKRIVVTVRGDRADRAL